MMKYNIILASNSPRRKQLLKGLGVDFEVRVLSGIDESYPSELDIDIIAEYIAKKKSAAYMAGLAKGELLITSDTIVANEKKVFGKPHNRAEAIAMLKELNNKTHRVITGVCIATVEKTISFSAETMVAFANMSEEEIEYYVDKFQPLDKAGAYGIQEWIGFIGVSRIEGSYFNVVGFPVQRVYEVLKNEFSVSVF